MAKQDLAFSSRFIPNALQAQNYCKFSMSWLPVCPQWRMLRRILNINIFSTNRLDANQHLRSQKVNELIAYCEKCCQQGEAVDVGQIVFKTNLNLASNTLFSKDLVHLYSDSKLKVELKDVIWGIVDVAGKINLVDFFPLLEKNKASHKHPFCAENPQEMDQNYVNSMLLDIFIGGIDTITSTLEWAMAEILRQPEIMKKVQAEIAQVVGKGKPIIFDSDGGGRGGLGGGDLVWGEGWLVGGRAGRGGVT
ncbi:geraniol 8-hydroxylase-like [Solanum verrucosum]|uniref:geraniol 8-hydroxylase-like n=1 Tax=Solanum verrucosum TaxID=315347 RepID=UPI0020D068B0|nr:geraniol 8-hydroxylase-like [Solanum verrucosum]